MSSIALSYRILSGSALLSTLVDLLTFFFLCNGHCAWLGVALSAISPVAIVRMVSHFALALKKVTSTPAPLLQILDTHEQTAPSVTYRLYLNERTGRTPSLRFWAGCRLAVPLPSDAAPGCQRLPQSLLHLLFEFLARRCLLCSLQLNDVRPCIRAPQQPFAEEVAPRHNYITVDGHIAMPHAGEHQHLKALICFDERVCQPHRINHAHVIVHISGGQHQVALQVFRDFRVLVNLVEELLGSVLLRFFPNPVVLLAPRVVVHVVVVVPRF